MIYLLANLTHSSYNEGMNTAYHIVVKDDVQNIIDHFCYCFNIRILFYYPDGTIMKIGLNRPDSGFCRLLRYKLYNVETCLTMDETKRKEAEKSKKLITYTCYAGLTECVIPIYAHNHHLGYAMIGQFRETDHAAPQVLSDWNELFGTDELVQEFQTLPYYRRESVNHIIGLFRMLVDYIVQKELLSLKSGLIIDKISKYIDENIDRPILITEAAEQVQKSISGLSHLIKEYTGKSFKQYYIEKKIEHAKRLFLDEPDKTIADVAEQVGYRDPFYFSRIFRKYCGKSPREYRAN